MKKFRSLFLLPLALFIGTLTMISCEEAIFPDSHAVSEARTDANGFFDLQNNLISSLDSTELDCFEINFPVDVNFPDGTSQTMNSESELETAIDTWIDNNPNSFDWPELAFPVSVTLEDGTVQSVANDDELCDLYLECYGDELDEDGYLDLIDALEDSVAAFDCFEIIFPVDISFPDGTTQTVQSESEMESAIDTWFNNNPNATDFPALVFPIDVQLPDSSIQSVPDDKALCDLALECLGDEFLDEGYLALEDSLGFGDWIEPDCFTIDFPVDVDFPDGTTQTINSQSELDTAIGTWINNNPNSEDWPLFSFPITVTLEDGTSQAVGSDEELCDLYVTCWEGFFGD